MTELESALAAFLPNQRWFAGKGRQIGEVRIEVDVPLRGARPSLHSVLAAVAYADGGVERYHLPIGHDFGFEARSLLSRRPGALIMETKPPREGVYYDAVADERLGAVFLEMLSRGATLDQLRFYRAPEWNETLRGPGKLLDAEQSNSSLVFSNRLILKLFRLLQPGENPELEVTRALAASGFDACPAPLGWIEGLGSTLGVLQRYYAGSVEGWRLAVERVADHYESEDPGNFAGEARELGRVTAELHAALAAALPKVSEDQPAAGRGRHAALVRLRGALAAGARRGSRHPRAGQGRAGAARAGGAALDRGEPDRVPRRVHVQGLQRRLAAGPAGAAAAPLRAGQGRVRGDVRGTAPSRVADDPDRWYPTPAR